MTRKTTKTLVYLVVEDPFTVRYTVKLYYCYYGGEFSTQCLVLFPIKCTYTISTPCKGGYHTHLYCHGATDGCRKARDRRRRDVNPSPVGVRSVRFVLIEEDVRGGVG